MIKRLIVKLIQQKNPSFQLDSAVSSTTFFSLVLLKSVQLMRNVKVLLQGNFATHLFLGKNVQFFNLSNIKFGKWVQLDDHVYVSGLGKQLVVFGNNVRIGAFSRVVASTSFNNVGEFIRIGNNVGIGEFAYLGGGGGLEIGDDCIIGQYFSCHPENHNFNNSDDLIRLQGVTRQGIRIGNNCWIGSKVTILDGVEIGENCVIAAGAVVTKSMPSNTIIGGVPAKVIKKINPADKKVLVNEINLN